MSDGGDHFRKDPHFPDKRCGSYGVCDSDIQFLLVVNENSMTDEEHDELAQFMACAAAAWLGNRIDNTRVVHAVNRVAFGFDRKHIPDEWIAKIQEALHWAFSLILGTETYDRKQDGDWGGTYGKHGGLGGLH